MCLFGPSVHFGVLAVQPVNYVEGFSLSPPSDPPCGCVLDFKSDSIWACSVSEAAPAIPVQDGVVIDIFVVPGHEHINAMKPVYALSGR